MTVSLAAWATAVDGKTIGSGECVALTNSYSVEVVGSPPVPTSGDNYAITAYESFPAGGMDQFYTRVGALGPFRPGDQIFWRRGSFIAPLSHTAVVMADLGPAIDCMSQNTNGHRYAERTTLPQGRCGRGVTADQSRIRGWPGPPCLAGGFGGRRCRGRGCGRPYS